MCFRKIDERCGADFLSLIRTWIGNGSYGYTDVLMSYGINLENIAGRPFRRYCRYRFFGYKPSSSSGISMVCLNCCHRPFIQVFTYECHKPSHAYCDCHHVGLISDRNHGGATFSQDQGAGGDISFPVVITDDSWHLCL